MDQQLPTSQKINMLLRFVQSLKSSNVVNMHNKRSVFTYTFLENTDLWTCPITSSLCHCVALDLGMSAGIAVDFVNKFNSRKELEEQNAQIGECAILKRNNRFIYYLITKPISKKPPNNYDGLIKSLQFMKTHALKNNVKQISMPKIGSGLDRLKWDKVENILKNTFKDTDISITVYQYNPPHVPRKKKKKTQKRWS
eukprot:226514_1